MNSIFNSALKQSSSLRHDLDTFAEAPATTPPALQGQISATLTSFSRTIDDYSEIAKKELIPAKQEKARERIKNFRTELLDYRQSFERLKTEREESQTSLNRTELLGRRPHHTATPENPYANSSLPNHSPFAPAQSATSLSFGANPTQQNFTRESHALREQSFFSSSNAQLDEYLERGRAVLGDLGQQREMLKGTQKRLYSVANTLGAPFCLFLPSFESPSFEFEAFITMATNGPLPNAPTRASPAPQGSQGPPVPNGKPISPYVERSNPMGPSGQIAAQTVSSKDPKAAAQAASDIRNVVRRKLTGYVGFANLPNQWHRKSVRKGFNFNVMVVGESGLGKSTLVNTLFNTSLYPPKERKGPSLDIIPKTVSIQSISADIEENGVRLRLTVVDTPGFGDFVNNDDSWRPIVENIEQRFDAYLDAENKVNRMNIVDNRVHACVYFIQPTGHALKPLDIEVMRRLHTKVNLIPVIAKADTLTDEEIAMFKERILTDIQHHSIRIFEGPRYELDDEETIAENQEIMSKVPFAVVGANSEVSSQEGRKVRGRRYPWGVIEVDNEEHCDFVKLRQMLIRTHMEELKEHTNNALYENYRSDKLTQMGVAQDPSVFKEVNPAVKQEEERTLHEQKLQKMESEMKMVFQQKVAEKESKLKQSEEELYARHREMKEQLERTRLELEEKKQRVESGRPLEEKGKRKGFSLR